MLFKNPLPAIKYRLDTRRARRTRQKSDRLIEHYFAALIKAEPTVIIAANFLQLGGIRQHIMAIAKYSSIEPVLIPSDKVSKKIDRHEIESLYSDLLFQLNLPKLVAVHTHVFPWAIRFGRHRQSMGARWIHTYHLLYSDQHSLGEMPSWQEEFNSAQIEEGRHADVCLSVSRWQTTFLQEKHGIPAVYLPNGVDLHACEYASANRFVRQFGEFETFALYIGRDDPVKNPAEFAQVAKQMPDLHFIMVGRSLGSEYLETNYGVSPTENLTFIPEIPHKTALDAIAACAVLVVTSKREGLPTLILEAMAQGKPVVAPDEPGCSEALGEGAYGFLYELGDIADLKEKIIQALTDTEKPHQARKCVIEHYDWRVIAPQLDRIYVGEN